MRITLSGTEVVGSYREVNQILVTLARSGRSDAADQLLIINDKLIGQIVTKYTGLDKESSWWEDLMQEGRMGVMHALPRYQEKKGLFMTYAQCWIRQFVQRYLGRFGVVTVPQGTYWKARREDPDEEEPEDEEERNKLERAKAMYEKARVAMAPNTRLNQYDDLAQAVDPTLPVAGRDFADFVISIVSQHKNSRVCYIVRKFYGLDDGEEARTLKDIGDEFGLTKERIRQLRNEGLDLVKKVLL